MKKKPNQISRTRHWLTGIALFKFCAISIYLLWDSMADVLDHFQQMFGDVSWLFAILMVVLIAEVLHLIFFRSCTIKFVVFIGMVAPAVGLLGTVSALMDGFTNLNLGGMELDKAISRIVVTIALSLKTTAAGLIIGLFATAVHELLIPVLHRAPESPSQKKNMEHDNHATETVDSNGTAGEPDLSLVPLGESRVPVPSR